MATMNQAVLTQQGIQLMNEAGTGINTISFTKAVTSSDERYPKLSDDQLETLTDLDNIQQTVKPSEPYPAFTFNDSDGNQQYSDKPAQGFVKSKSATTVPMVFKNKGIDADGKDYLIANDYLIQAIGLYAHDGNRNQDVLYLVITSSTPFLMTAYDGNVASFKVKEITGVGRTDKLSVVVGDFDTITEDELEAKLADYVSASTPQNLSNDFNFNGKLQHNGVDIVDINKLNQTIANFSGDDKDHNFTAGLKYHGMQVATQQDVQNALVNKRGDFAQGRSLNELIGDYGVYDINNHDLISYKENQGLPTDLGPVYGSIIPFSGTGFTIIFIFLANGRVFTAPRSQYVNAPFKELASIDQVNAKFGDAYNRAVADAEQYTDKKINDYNNPTPLPSCDLNTVTKPGIYQLIYTNSYTHTPSSYFNGANALLIVETESSNIYQTIKLGASSANIICYRNNDVFLGKNDNWNNWETFNLLGLPITSLQAGDDYDNYNGRSVHLDINGINIATDIANSKGLPNTKVYGEFISIANHNATTEIINDNLGNSWRRVVGRKWAQVVSSTFPINSNIPDELNGYNVSLISNGGNLSKYTTPSDTIYYSAPGNQITGSPYGTEPFILQVVSDANGYFQNIINTDKGKSGQPYSRGEVYFDWRTSNYYDTANDSNYNYKFKNQLFKQFGGGI